MRSVGFLFSVLIALATVGVGVLTVQSLPEIRRYLGMRNM